MVADVWRWCPEHQTWLQDANASVTKAGLARANESTKTSSYANSTSERDSSSRLDCFDQFARSPSSSAGSAEQWRENGSPCLPLPPPTPSNSLIVQKTRQVEGLTAPASKSPLGNLQFCKDVAPDRSEAINNVTSRQSKWHCENYTPSRSSSSIDTGSNTRIAPWQQNKSNELSVKSNHMSPHHMMGSQQATQNECPPLNFAKRSENWVTVFCSQPAACDDGGECFRFGRKQVSMVMREFEKCGKIVDRVVGPQGSNWIHLRYQTPHDSGMALLKDGLQLNEAFTVSVRYLDRSQREHLSDEAPWKSKPTGFVDQVNEGVVSNEDTEMPPKSSVSKFVDLVFDCERDYQITTAGFLIPITFGPGLYKDLFTKQMHRCAAFVTPYCDPAAAMPMYFEYPRAQTEPCTFSQSCLDPLRKPSSTCKVQQDLSTLPAHSAVFPDSPLKGVGDKVLNNSFATIEMLKSMRDNSTKILAMFDHEDRSGTKEQGRHMFTKFSTQPEPQTHMGLHVHEASMQDMYPSSELPKKAEGMPGQPCIPDGPSRHTRHELSCSVSEEYFDEEMHACPILQTVIGERPMATDFCNQQKLQARRHKTSYIYTQPIETGRRLWPPYADSQPKQ